MVKSGEDFRVYWKLIRAAALILKRKYSPYGDLLDGIEEAKPGRGLEEKAVWQEPLFSFFTAPFPRPINLEVLLALLYFEHQRIVLRARCSSGLLLSYIHRKLKIV